MYDIVDHGWMIRDRVRSDAYAAAIRRTVRPGDVVLDLGAGTGIFALLACQAGARRVFAVETSAYLEVARELAAANGFADRIECIQADSTAIELAERADVIVFDIRGVLPLFGTALRVIVDARDRHLRPGGTMLPRRETLFVALVESPDTYARHAEPWTSGAYGLELGSVRRMATSETRKVYCDSRDVISEVAAWTTLDYATLTSTDANGTVSLAAQRGGTAHGCIVWFDAELAEGIVLSNSPHAPRTLYGSVFFPFEQPVAVRAGEAIEVDLAAKLVNDDDYVWRWNTTLVRGGERVPLFRQSSFFAYPHR
ncbi:MAG TPA: class I SAM-dependent methyltransferase [Thermoanaerobaculia bacterium]